MSFQFDILVVEVMNKKKESSSVVPILLLQQQTLFQTLNLFIILHNNLMSISS